MFIFGIIPHHQFEKSISHIGYIIKPYPPNLLPKVLSENIQGQHTCHMECRDMVSHQCAFSNVLQEHNTMRKISHTSCIYKVFPQYGSSYVLLKFEYLICFLRKSALNFYTTTFNWKNALHLLPLCFCHECAPPYIN